MNKQQYKPLPDFLTVQQSAIHGLGIFAKKDVANKTNLGLSHVINQSPHIFVRTPLGGFLNHNADDPNCKLVRDMTFPHLMFAIATRHIKKGEELTIAYTSYDPEEKIDDHDTEFEEVKEEE